MIKFGAIHRQDFFHRIEYNSIICLINKNLIRLGLLINLTIIIIHLSHIYFILKFNLNK